MMLLGEEKERFMARQKSSRPTPLAKSEDAALDRLRSDLLDSSDEEESRNPMEQARQYSMCRDGLKRLSKVA